MVTIDSGITFDFPETWERFTDGSRWVFRTPRREEIIVSASRVSGDVSATEHVFASGLQAARRGASHPDLRITQPLGEESGICAFRCATILSETTVRDAFFGQAVIQHPCGVVFLTYEAPFIDSAEQTFRDLLRSIRES